MNINVSQNIKAFRKRAGLTQKNLADKLGCTLSTISKYEQGQREPDFEVLEQISEVLGVSLSDLVRSQEEVKQDTSFYFEQLIKALGIEIIFDEEDGYMVLRTDDGEFEINIQDVNDLNNSTCSFIKYKISEIKSKSRKIGK